MQHRLHLPRDAGHCVDDGVAHGADQPRCGAPSGYGGGALGYVGLAEVVLRHGPPPRREHLADPLGDPRVAAEGYAHDGGDGLAGDVVLRGTEAAGHDDGVGPAEGLLQGGDDALGVVAHLGGVVDVDAGIGEGSGDGRRVGVVDLAEQQLRPDGEDLSAHA